MHTEAICLRVYLGGTSDESLRTGIGPGNVLFVYEEPAEEHVDDHAATAEDDVHGHGYVVCERGIIEDGEHKEECDLHKVGQKRDSTCS